VRTRRSSELVPSLLLFPPKACLATRLLHGKGTPSTSEAMEREFWEDSEFKFGGEVEGLDLKKLEKLGDGEGKGEGRGTSGSEEGGVEGGGG